MDIMMNQLRSTTQKLHLWCNEWTMAELNTSQRSMKRERENEQALLSK